MSINLNFKKVELLPEETRCYQVENGTIFYFKWTLPQKLYVGSEFDRLTATLPPGEIAQVIVHGNALYFVNKGNIYKAEVISGFIAVMHQRYLQPGEFVLQGGKCSYHQDGKEYIYHVFEDPRYIRPYVSITPVNGFIGGIFKGIHRGRAVFLKCSERSEIDTSEEDVTRVSLPVSLGETQFFAQDATPFIYFNFLNELFTVNTITLEHLPVVSVNNVSGISIIAVRDGKMTMTGKESGKDFLLTAQLPTEYYKWDPGACSDKVNKINRCTIEATLDRDFAAYFSDQKAKHLKENRERCDGQIIPASSIILDSQAQRTRTIVYEEMSKVQEEINDTINGLLDKNAQLTQQLEGLKQAQETNVEANEQVMKRNGEVEMMIAQLESENEAIFKNLERTQVLNDELEAANDQLVEEKDEMIREDDEITSKIKKLRDKLSMLNLEKERINTSEEMAISPADVIVENKELKEKLGAVIKDNEKLCASLDGRNSKKVQNALTENEQMMN